MDDAAPRSAGEPAPEEPGLFRALLPASVEVVEGPIGDAGIDALYEAEAGAVARAVPKRRAEFAAGRLFAREAMRRLGLAATPLPAGSDRAPVWPAGMVGSITHSDDRCAAALGLASRVAALGIDLDRIERFHDDIERVIASPVERERLLQGLDPAARQRRLTLVFCAKEATYKCQYQLTREWLNFHDLELEVASEAGGGRFRARLMKAVGGMPAGHAFDGRWAEGGGFLAAAVVVER